MKEQFEKITKGFTYKNKTQDHTFYTTINRDDEGKIVEIFVRINDPELFEMIQLVTRLSSALLNSGYSPEDLAEDLIDVHSPVTMHIIPGTSIMCPSIISRIGMVLKKEIERV